MSVSSKILRTINVSLYDDIRSSLPVLMTVGEVLDVVKGNQYMSQISKIRMLIASGKKEEANAIKMSLGAVTFSATFEASRRASLHNHYNHLLVIDIDKLSDEEMVRVGDCLLKDDHIYSYWKSPSGKGWKGLVPIQYDFLDKRIDVSDMHRMAFLQLEDYLEDAYGIQLDESGKDITRLCFMSWCPDLVEKQEVIPFFVQFVQAAQIARKKEAQMRSLPQQTAIDYNWKYLDGVWNGDDYQLERKLLENIYRFLKKRNMSLTSSNIDWVKVAYGIASKFHPAYGRKIFMKFCELDGINHDPVRSENLIWRAYNEQRGLVNFSTIVYLAKQKGFIV